MLHKFGGRSSGRHAATHAEVDGEQLGQDAGVGAEASQSAQLIGSSAGGGHHGKSGLSALHLANVKSANKVGRKVGKVASAFKKSFKAAAGGGGPPSPKRVQGVAVGTLDVEVAGDGAGLLAVEDAEWLQDSDSSDGAPFIWQKSRSEEFGRAPSMSPTRTRSPTDFEVDAEDLADMEEVIMSTTGSGQSNDSDGGLHLEASFVGPTDDALRAPGKASATTTKSRGAASRARAAWERGWRKAGKQFTLGGTSGVHHAADPEQGVVADVAATILGTATGGASSSSAPRPLPIQWDAKRFAHVKPLNVGSIWDIPTSTDPNPEPPQRSRDPLGRPADAQRGGDTSRTSEFKSTFKSFGSAEIFSAEASGPPSWQPKPQSATFSRRLKLICSGFLAFVSLLAIFKFLFG